MQEYYPPLGKKVMKLKPTGDQNMYGRSGFYIHGDNGKGDYSASEGCIILELKFRNAIDSSEYKTLEVVE